MKYDNDLVVNIAGRVLRYKHKGYTNERIVECVARDMKSPRQSSEERINTVKQSKGEAMKHAVIAFAFVVIGSGLLQLLIDGLAWKGFLVL